MSTYFERWSNRPAYDWVARGIVLGGVAVAVIGASKFFVQLLGFGIVLLGPLEFVIGKRRVQRRKAT